MKVNLAYVKCDVRKGLWNGLAQTAARVWSAEAETAVRPELFGFRKAVFASNKRGMILSVKESYERARHILKTHGKEHRNLADALLMYETLDAKEIQMVLEGKSLDSR